MKQLRARPNFSYCAHAGAQRGSTRPCYAPQLAGLELVDADFCSGCWYQRDQPESRDSVHVSDEAALRGMDCAYFDSGEVKNFTTPLVLSGTPCACRHPAHGTITRDDCAKCLDYLFPILSPRMPIESAARLLKLILPGCVSGDTDEAVRPRILDHDASLRRQSEGWQHWPNVQAAARKLAAECSASLSEFPKNCSGRGIVIAGGGRYFPSAYITIRVLRHVGCELPIELWHFPGEVDATARTLLVEQGVRCVDAESQTAQNAFPFHSSWWRGWQLKVYAIRNSSFREVLYLDADSYPIRNPAFLFEWPPYRQQGAVFWPDLDSSAHLLPATTPETFGISRFRDRPTESGQLLIHKELCWRELNLALFYNATADYTYRVLWGDKDTFPIAWRRLGRTYARMWSVSRAMPQGILQFDDRGDVLFQHRVNDKFRLNGAAFDSTWQLESGTQYNSKLMHEEFCFSVLRDLERQFAV